MGRSEKDTATRKFTDMDATALRASMGRFEGVCVVATVNPDGTPDAAIFAPAMPDDEHVILMLADNTRAPTSSARGSRTWSTTWRTRPRRTRRRAMPEQGSTLPWCAPTETPPRSTAAWPRAIRV